MIVCVKKRKIKDKGDFCKYKPEIPKVKPVISHQLDKNVAGNWGTTLTQKIIEPGEGSHSI